MQKRKQLHNDVIGNLHDEAACKGFERFLLTISLRDILLFWLEPKK
jgi:hypothetical protein